MKLAIRLEFAIAFLTGGLSPKSVVSFEVRNPIKRSVTVKWCGVFQTWMKRRLSCVASQLDEIDTSLTSSTSSTSSAGALVQFAFWLIGSAQY